MNSILKGAQEALQRSRGGSPDGNPRWWEPPSGETIKALRKRLGLTQSEFAAQYGLDVKSVENWEQERRAPDRAAALLLNMIEREPETIARIISDVKNREPEAV